MEISLEDAIQQFFKIADELSASKDLTAHMALEKICRFYNETRIQDAKVEVDGDMILLQWGATKAILVDEPTDLRSSGQVDFENIERQYLDFTRQVFVEPEGEDIDFDGSAVQIALTLYFGEAFGNEPSGNMWIESPADLEQSKREYTQDEFVNALLSAQVKKINAVVGYCG